MTTEMEPRRRVFAVAKDRKSGTVAAERVAPNLVQPLVEAIEALGLDAYVDPEWDYGGSLVSWDGGDYPDPITRHEARND